MEHGDLKNYLYRHRQNEITVNRRICIVSLDRRLSLCLLSRMVLRSRKQRWFSWPWTWPMACTICPIRSSCIEIWPREIVWSMAITLVKWAVSETPLLEQRPSILSCRFRLDTRYLWNGLLSTWWTSFLAHPMDGTGKSSGRTLRYRFRCLVVRRSSLGNRHAGRTTVSRLRKRRSCALCSLR